MQYIVLVTHSNNSPPHVVWRIKVRSDGRVCATITNHLEMFTATAEAKAHTRYYRDLSDLLLGLERGLDESKVGLAIQAYRGDAQELWRLGLRSEYRADSIPGRIWALVDQLRGDVLNNGKPESWDGETVYMSFHTPSDATTSGPAWDAWIMPGGHTCAELTHREKEYAHTLKADVDIALLGDLSDLLDRLERNPDFQHEAALTLWRHQEGTEETWRLGPAGVYVPDSPQGQVWACIERLQSVVLNNWKEEWFVPFCGLGK